jgi:DNA-binding transcriptional MocR family regulator
MSERLGVSVPTVKQAYIELERRGKLEARPQSGFYVRARKLRSLIKPICKDCEPVSVNCRSLIEQVYEGIHRPDVVPFGIANPSMAHPSTKALHRTMKRVMARAEERSLGYAPTTGEPGLKRQLAFRYLDRGFQLDPDEIIVTNGGQEALALALQSVARKGDVIAVESPTYHGMLELIESLGMLALEVKTCTTGGVILDSLEKALDRHPVAACMFSSTLNNPLGSVTCEDHRARLVAMLEQREIPLIEDDVYGELLFDGSIPRPGQLFSRKGMVLTCGSFSKTAAPGYRIGWLIPGRFGEQAQRLKRCLSCSSGLLQQLTLAEFLASGDYDRQLKALRPVLQSNAERMAGMVMDHFPTGTLSSSPRGGSVLWLQMPNRIDSVALFEQALNEQISTAPGLVFSTGRRYRNYLRLSFGHPWTPRLEWGIRKLGEIACEMAVTRQSKVARNS